MKRTYFPGNIDIVEVTDPAEIRIISNDSRFDQDFIGHGPVRNVQRLRKMLRIFSLNGRLFPPLLPRANSSRAAAQDELWSRLNVNADEKVGILPFDANDWLAQLEAMIHHDVAHGGQMNDAARRVKARVLLVAAAQDHMVNPKPVLDFAALIRAKTLLLESDCGHLAPHCEADKLNPAVRDFLDGR